MASFFPKINIKYIKSLASAAVAKINGMDVDKDYYNNASSEMYGLSPEFPMVPFNSTDDHVLIHRPTKGPPADIWYHSFVRMPFSKSNNIYKKQIPKWKVIESVLKKYSIESSHDLENAVLKYNEKFIGTWQFDGLHRYFSEYLSKEEADYFFKVTLPYMKQLALKLPELVQVAIPMLEKNKTMAISMSQMQIASLLANAFFCTFPRRNEQGPRAEYKDYPKINFNSLFASTTDGAMEKMKCILHYFERIRKNEPDGVLTFARRHVYSCNCPDWRDSEVKIDSVIVEIDDKHKIEDMNGYIQVDFANKYLGGGVLGSGCVQEEIRFVICPELMVAMLFTEKLDDGDAILILGCERYSSYCGYGRHGFKFDGDFVDQTPRDGSGRRQCAVLAIDAIEFHNEEKQFTHRNLLRELNKAWIGFSFYTDPKSKETNLPGVATGNWGCGAFGGSPQLKSLLQIAAAAQARRPLRYLTFGDSLFKHELTQVYGYLCRHDVTVGQLCKLVPKYYNEVHKGMDLYTFLKKELTAKSNSSFSMSEVSEMNDQMHTLLKNDMTEENWSSSTTEVIDISDQEFEDAINHLPNEYPSRIPAPNENNFTIIVSQQGCSREVRSPPNTTDFHQSSYSSVCSQAPVHSKLQRKYIGSLNDPENLTTNSNMSGPSDRSVENTQAGNIRPSKCGSSSSNYNTSYGPEKKSSDDYKHTHNVSCGSSSSNYNTSYGPEKKSSDDYKHKHNVSHRNSTPNYQSDPSTSYLHSTYAHGSRPRDLKGNSTPNYQSDPSTSYLHSTYAHGSRPRDLKGKSNNWEKSSISVKSAVEIIEEKTSKTSEVGSVGSHSSYAAQQNITSSWENAVEAMECETNNLTACPDNPIDFEDLKKPDQGLEAEHLPTQRPLNNIENFVSLPDQIWYEDFYVDINHECSNFRNRYRNRLKAFIDDFFKSIFF